MMDEGVNFYLFCWEVLGCNNDHNYFAPLVISMPLLCNFVIPSVTIGGNIPDSDLGHVLAMCFDSVKEVEVTMSQF